MTSQRFSILDIPFDIISLDSALEMLESRLRTGDKCFCTTPNPEICLESLSNPTFRKLLQKSDLSIPDGFGILWAARYLSGERNFIRWIWTLLTPWNTWKTSPIRSRVTGTDIMKFFCKTYPNRKIFLLGASKHVNEKLAKLLKGSGTNIVGNFSGSPSKKLEPVIISLINASEADVLFVAFGAPKQELWISRNLECLLSVKVAIGVGGAFDFLSGERKRAPKWMQNVGLEWFFRLLIEPSRIRRIFRATILFPWKVYRFKQK